MTLQLVREHPETIDYQHGLCTCWNQVASFQASKGRLREANAASQEAWTIADKLVRKYPRVEKPLGALNVAFRDLVGRARSAGKPLEGLNWCQKQIETLEVVLQQPGRVQAAPWHLCYAYVQGGRVLDELGQHCEAVMEFSRALDLADEQPHRHRLLLRPWVLAHMGQHAAATAQACASASQAPVMDRCLYYAACVHSLASETARNDSNLSPADRSQLAEEYATRALNFLNQARANGYFKNAVNIVPLKMDDDFAPLRKRADFGQFLLLLEQEKGWQAQPSGAARK